MLKKHFAKSMNFAEYGSAVCRVAIQAEYRRLVPAAKDGIQSGFHSLAAADGYSVIVILFYEYGCIGKQVTVANKVYFGNIAAEPIEDFTAYLQAYR